MGRKMKAAVRTSVPRTTRSQTAASTAVTASAPAERPQGKSTALDKPARPTSSATAAAAAAPTRKAPVARRPALPTLFFASATAWEAWLSAQQPSASSGVWLKLAKKASGVASVSYDAAVDAALCHGWIDGQRRRCDDDDEALRFFLQRFTPRRRRSVWSRRNVARVAALLAEGRMAPAGLREVDAARADGRWERAY
ncbi:hypothetical protein HRG_000042 [Hirsutella rhossiliensis]|uniref:Uncharacterized protein n=1 Tax=Hirsutella rhossiliensis TaxID=111463 RepID=A0A9P8SN06_9HYPO|nr:uncharacterized protein HRG_00042 [Hirsutella rhossiliensis]KAH0967400.1 hypothetical protein HRG_00042 [Hirsutella rhossiliensis]